MSDYEGLTDRELMELVVARMFPTSWKGYCCEESFARLVRDRIAELGLKTQFIDALAVALNLSVADFHERSRRSAIWLMLNATPRQQCVAALLALANAPR